MRSSGVVDVPWSEGTTLMFEKRESSLLVLPGLSKVDSSDSDGAKPGEGGDLIAGDCTTSLSSGSAYETAPGGRLCERFIRVSDDGD